jgi:microcystin degradation protein MlrC
MNMRILVGGMNHESNSLNPIITGEDDFIVFRGDEILKNGMRPGYSSTGIINSECLVIVSGDSE